MIVRRRFANLVSPVGRELQMVGLLGMFKDDAVATFMVVKLGEYCEVKSFSIHLRTSFHH
jgi:hypothetical protein